MPVEVVTIPRLTNVKVGDTAEVVFRVTSPYARILQILEGTASYPTFDIIDYNSNSTIYERNYNPLKDRTLGVIIKVKKPAIQYNLNLTARVTTKPIGIGATIPATLPKPAAPKPTTPKPAAPKPVASTTTNQTTTVDRPAPQQQKTKTETPKKVDVKKTDVPKVNEEITTGDTNNLNQEKIKARSLYIVIGALSTIIVLGGATSGYFIYKAKKPSVDA